MSEFHGLSWFATGMEEDFRRDVEDGKLVPIEISINELLEIADSRGYKTRVQWPVTDDHHGNYEIKRGEDIITLHVTAGEASHGAVWVRNERMGLFNNLFMGGR